MAANEVGRQIAAIKAKHGWTWAQTGEHLGMTGTYARKLAGGSGKFGTPGAGRSFAANVAKFAKTGRTQKPVQRAQRVRAKGGGSKPAPVRKKAVKARPTRFGVTRDAFAGGGTMVKVTLPRSGPNRIKGELTINNAIKDAKKNRRRVAFQVKLYDGHERTVGGSGGLDATKTQFQVNVLEDGYVLRWLAQQASFQNYPGKGLPMIEKNIGEVTVVILPAAEGKKAA